jgi:hypothetical protein
MMLSKVCYLQVISPFSQFFFYRMIQTYEIGRSLRKHIQVAVIKISSCGSFYFWSYTPWKIGFVASPETSLKQGVSGKNVITSS